MGVALASVFVVFSHQASSNVSFTTGTLDIHASPNSAVFSLTNMAPGDSQYAALSISNAGSLGLRYTVSASTTNADGKNLAGLLNAEVRKVSSSCSAASFAASADAIAPPRKLDVLASASPRRIAAGKGEVACFKVSLPVNAGNKYQNATTTATFTIDAIQAKHRW